MKSKIQEYPQAFIDLLEEMPDKKDLLIVGLVKAIKENGDLNEAEKILESIEKRLLKVEGRKKIEIFSARPLTKETIEEIKKCFDSKDIFENKINQDLLAGIKIMINGNQVIDASLRKKINILFNS
jgi:F0F1-type ATP synthase delta subunit